jgi:hypothetical protein
MPLTPDKARSILIPLSASQRAEAIRKDIDSGQRKFASLDPFELADLLQVPQPESPENSWCFVTGVRVRLLDDYLEEGYFDSAADLTDNLADLVESQRLKEIEDDCVKYDDGAREDFSFLHPEERKHLEMEFARENLTRLRDNGLGCTAFYCVTSGNQELWFHASIEDDGTCFNLLTPYDGINGPLPTENDSTYICETW